MIAFAALITGLLSTLLVMALWLGVLGAMSITQTDPAVPLISFFVILAGSVYVIRSGARSASAVWARGALIGAVEWMVVGLVIIGGAFGGLISAVERDASPAAFGGRVLASGLITTVGLGFVLFMVVCSLTVWFVANKVPKEFTARVSDDVDPRRHPCPNCAEQILPAAKICPFCKMTVSSMTL